MAGASALQKLEERPLRAYACITAIAVLLTVPALLTPMKIHDSFWIDWVWADQFTDQLRQGVLYPRWLPSAHDGLGSPAFYYYPPLAFYLTGIFGLVGFSTYGSIICAFAAGFLLSGVTMYAWLRDWAPRPVLGAGVYMAAPYHVLDFYGRGALAEFVAIAIIPAVVLGLRRIREGRRSGILLTSISYAAMICTHLPLALLTSLFLIGPYALIVTWRQPATIARFALPLALGIGLAAIYLVPALALEPYRDAAKLWAGASTTAENWTVWAAGSEGPAEGMRALVLKMLVVRAIPAAAYAIAWRSAWGAYAALCCILAAGLIPFFWSLPLLASVQYPFRAFPLAEFGIATGAALLPRLKLEALLALLPAMLLSLLFLASPAPPMAGVTPELLAERHPEVPENLPPGERPYSWPSRWALELSSVHREPAIRSGGTVEPIFYFPAWEVRCQGRVVATSPASETQLLSYHGQGCSRTLALTGAERTGALISALALILLIGFAIRSRRPLPVARQAYASS